MFCIQCGKKLPDGAKFCMYCGAKLPVMDEDGEQEEASVSVSEEPTWKPAKPRISVHRANNTVILTTGEMFCIQSDGTIGGPPSDGIHDWGDDYYFMYHSMRSWRNVESLLFNKQMAVIGVTKEGKVLVSGDESNISNLKPIEQWTNVVKVADDYEHIIGLQKNGKLLIHRYKGRKEENDDLAAALKSWPAVVDIDAYYGVVAGVTPDGHVLVALSKDWFQEYKDSQNAYGSSNPIKHTFTKVKNDIQRQIDLMTDVRSVIVGCGIIYAITNAGRVLTAVFHADYIDAHRAYDPESRLADVSSWHDIVSVTYLENPVACVIGLQKDGRLVQTPSPDIYGIDVSKLRNIARIASVKYADTYQRPLWFVDRDGKLIAVPDPDHRNASPKDLYVIHWPGSAYGENKVRGGDRILDFRTLTVKV